MNRSSRRLRSWPHRCCLVPAWGLREAARADDAEVARHPRRLCAVRIPGRPLEWSGRAQGQPGEAIPRLGRDAHLGLDLRRGKAGRTAVTIEGGKVLATGKLTYDAAGKIYHLDATEPKPRRGRISFEGTLDKSGKILVLEHTGMAEKSGKDAGKLRLSIWPNANFIRYTMTADRKEPGAIRFTR